MKNKKHDRNDQKTLAQPKDGAGVWGRSQPTLQGGQGSLRKRRGQNVNGGTNGKQRSTAPRGPWQGFSALNLPAGPGPEPSRQTSARSQLRNGDTEEGDAAGCPSRFGRLAYMYVCVGVSRLRGWGYWRDQPGVVRREVERFGAYGYCRNGSVIPSSFFRRSTPCC